MGDIQVGILTISDRCFNKMASDCSGFVIQKSIDDDEIFGSDFKVTNRTCIPDEHLTIKETLILWSDFIKLNLIFTSGGTGFSVRDVTPEATKEVLDKEASGISLALISNSLKVTPYAMLSRLVCGLRKSTLIINFPGSPKACLECLQILKPTIRHAISVIRNEKSVDITHKVIQSVKSKVDVSNVADRLRKSPYPLISVQEACSTILKTVKSQPPIILDIKNVLGYVLSENIIAKEPFPPFPASIKDGYAVICNDGAGKRKVISDSLAGEINRSEYLRSGECVRITTGAPVPSGADAVVQVEDTRLLLASDDGKTELEIDILQPPIFGQDIRKIGSDIEKESIVLSSGTVLSSAELGLLATIGACTIPVISRPKIGIFSTGNEIEPYDVKLSPGKIRDSNKITLLTLLKENGFNVIDCGIAVDEPNDILNKIQLVLPHVDVLITTGGVSMGEKDILTNVLVEDLNATVHFGRVNMKPGKPTKFFTIPLANDTKFVFGLPGNPVSATVTCHLFVLPALKAMSGYKNVLCNLLKVKISSDIVLDDRYEFARADLKWYKDDPVPWAVITGNQISCRLLSMINAKCLLHLPAATQSLKKLSAGQIVDAQLIGNL